MIFALRLLELGIIAKKVSDWLRLTKLHFDRILKALFRHFDNFLKSDKEVSNLTQILSQIYADSEKNTHCEVFKLHRVNLKSFVSISVQYIIFDPRLLELGKFAKIRLRLAPLLPSTLSSF